MNRIILATDFSEAADNAARTAAAIAVRQHAVLEWLHIYNYPVPVGDLPFPPVALGDVEKDIQRAFGGRVEAMKVLFPKLITETSFRPGLPAEAIEAAVNEKDDVTLVVMGVTGSGRAGQFLFGSTSVAVAGRLKCPVLLVPADAHWSTLHEVILATDLKESGNVAGLEMLRKWMEDDRSHLHLFNVLPKGVLPNVQQSVQGLKLDSFFAKLPHSFDFTEEENIEKGLEDFMARHPAGLLVMVRRPHSWFQKLIHSGHTRKMAYHTRIPLLILHEKQTV